MCAEECKPAESCNSSKASLDIGACSLCHNSLDFSDRAAFWKEDRFEDYGDDEERDDDSSAYFFEKTDPYFPTELYDPNNALLYCDSCDRMYHQRCHFVPVLVVPRGPWHCLVCASKKLPFYSTLRNAENLFRSPPVASAKQDEQVWEKATFSLKASLLTKTLTTWKQRFPGYVSQIRLARASVDAWMLTAPANPNLRSQDVAQWTWQTVWRRVQIHNALQALDDVRTNRNDEDRLLQFCKTVSADFSKRVVFPFGRKHGRRTLPLTLESNDGSEASVSLDEIACCVCFDNNATDENDLILCDGEKCCRAYHALQCSGKDIPVDEDDDSDWFCPLCQTYSDAMWNVQRDFEGDEWEQRRRAEKNTDTASLKSWDGVDEVFPTAMQDYPTALLIQKGVRNAVTDELTSRVLGIETEGIVDDDDEEDDHFDPDQPKQADEEEDLSEQSSNATLVDMSSVELEIGKDELAALSDDSSHESVSSGEGWGRRLRNGKREDPEDPGKLDKSNIIKGKRGRAPVDYILLNEAIFGNLPAAQRGKLDDADDFQVVKRKKDESSNSARSDDSSDGSDNDNDGSSKSEFGQ